ncbi:MAG: class I mannose-6-phosphate isomerase [Clostridia bacterium]|nr:class I mannose-6-phosphate isomerase [Clostridia bacterium]
MSNLYPLLMAPFFRHGEETPWGGNMLRDAFLKDAPDDRTGESLEVSALKGRESIVRNGIHVGKTFTRVIEQWGEDLTGPIEGEFPLLLKLLDAREMLSVQVHPGDQYGMEHDGKLGKSEAWVVLNAEPGAKIAYGLDTKGEDLRAIVESGKLESALHWEEVRPGDVWYIPNGTVHALGGGIQVYEIQQSSDATYRFWDWGRVGKDGKPRELHTEKALDVSDPNRHLSKNEGTTVLCKGGSRTYYISDKHFELCRLNLAGTMPLESGRMLFLTPTSECTLHWGDEEMALNAFDTVVVPAALEGVVLEGNTKVLMSSLPNREALREQLGYRAENVYGLMDE